MRSNAKNATARERNRLIERLGLLGVFREICVWRALIVRRQRNGARGLRHIAMSFRLWAARAFESEATGNLHRANYPYECSPGERSQRSGDLSVYRRTNTHSENRSIRSYVKRARGAIKTGKRRGRRLL